MKRVRSTSILQRITGTAIKMLVDIHTHLLPAIDDGPATAEQTVALARAAQKNGITHLAVTPHFYAWQHNLTERLALRTQQLEVLGALLQDSGCSFEAVLPGFEVTYFPNISTSTEVESLTLGGSRYLLLELNGGPVTPAVIQHIEELADRRFKVILAHIERFTNCRGFADLVPMLQRREVLGQVNSSSFSRLFWHRRMKELLQANAVHLIASDMHSVNKRPPKMAEAYAWVEKNCGSCFLKQLQENAQNVFEQAANTSMEMLLRS